MKDTCLMVVVFCVVWKHSSNKGGCSHGDLENFINPVPNERYVHRVFVKKTSWHVFVTMRLVLNVGPVSYTHLDVYKRQERIFRSEQDL